MQVWRDCCETASLRMVEVRWGMKGRSESRHLIHLLTFMQLTTSFAVADCHWLAQNLFFFFFKVMRSPVLFFRIVHAHSLLGSTVLKATSRGREQYRETVLLRGTVRCWLTHHSLNGHRLCSAHVVLVWTMFRMTVHALNDRLLGLFFISSIKNRTYLLIRNEEIPSFGFAKKNGRYRRYKPDNNNEWGKE
jgi:hypothetical protein